MLWHAIAAAKYDSRPKHFVASEFGWDSVSDLAKWMKFSIDRTTDEAPNPSDRADSMSIRAN